MKAVCWNARHDVRVETVTHRLKLSDARRAYEMFRDKEDECIKVVLDPADGAGR